MKVDLTRTYTRTDLSSPWPPRALDVSDSNGWHALKASGTITNETATESEDGLKLYKKWEINIDAGDMIGKYTEIINDQYVIYSNSEIIDHCNENNITYQMLQVKMYDDDGVTVLSEFPIDQFLYINNPDEN